MPDLYSPASNLAEEGFVRAPGRLMYCDPSVAFPTSISGIINMSTFAAAANIFDVGPTKGGVQVSFNNSEEGFDIDQVLTELFALPTDHTMTVQTQIATATLDWLSFAWEGTAPTINAAPTIPEKVAFFGPFDSYTQRRLFLGARRPLSGKIRFFAFRKVQKMPVESSITFNKTGEQQSIPVQFRVLPDTSIDVVKQRFMAAYDQQ
jgi:hypothetical protein